MNEKDYIRTILVNKIKPDDLSMGYFITLIAKYYYSEELDVIQLSDIVKEKILKFGIDNYQEYKYHNIIIMICNNLFDGKIEIELKEKEYIPIYENELNFINTLANDRYKKLMFTFFAVARYMNYDGWVNKKTSKELAELFKLANVPLARQKRNEILHELYKNGYIYFGRKINNLNFKVNLDDSGEIVYKIKVFENIGNQYIGNFKRGYGLCSTTSCGRIFKISGTNNKFCKQCARRKQLEKYVKYNEKR